MPVVRVSVGCAGRTAARFKLPPVGWVGCPIALTRCPRCGKPAVLVESRSIGPVETKEAGWQDVTERRIVCPAPAGCGADGEVLVVWRVDLLHGTSNKRTVPR